MKVEDISDILHVIDVLKQKGILMTVDVQKALRSVNHILLSLVLGKICQIDKSFTKKPRIAPYKWWNSNTIF